MNKLLSGVCLCAGAESHLQQVCSAALAVSQATERRRHLGLTAVLTHHADPFKNVALPEVIEEYLDYGVARCCAFNRRGTLLASTGKDACV